MTRGGSENNPHVHVFRPAKRHLHLFSAIAIALVSAMAIAACGGSSKPNSHGGSKSAGSFLAFSQCMRSHGVTNFPDPSSHGGLQLPTGFNTQAPSFKAAQTACFHKLPGGGPGNQKPTKQQVDQEVAVSECMRAHGVTGFPDPTVHTGGPPNVNPAQYSAVEDRGGVIIAIPKSIDTNSPVFKHASQTCNFH